MIRPRLWESHHGGWLASVASTATSASSAFFAGAVLGLVGKQIALKLSTAWGGLAKHKPLLDAVLTWQTPTPPKFDSERSTLLNASPPPLDPVGIAPAFA